MKRRMGMRSVAYQAPTWVSAETKQKLGSWVLKPFASSNRNSLFRNNHEEATDNETTETMGEQKLSVFCARNDRRVRFTVNFAVTTRAAVATIVATSRDTSTITSFTALYTSV